jgi:TolB-like protein
MASLIPGFEFDIFISYRQKDNKYDGWVTEFVDNLKKELEATFKEEISVYFDINPHDGLLETHDVNASLKDKLKSLIFIPIISRTYCDPKSFAWEHEFMAFADQAAKDRFGLKIKLLGGNVAKRVLPVRIHDLNASDVELFESSTGGVIRGVDFIYKSAGVNRPLRANEDHPHDNFNKTYYRDQINKVANAIEEIISSLTSDQSVTGEEKTKPYEPEPDIKKGDKRKTVIREAGFSRKSKKRQIMVLSIFLFVAVAFAAYKILAGGQKIFSIKKLEKSIAVLPFINDSPDQENTYFINGLMEEVLNDLQKISDCRVISRRSVEQYRNQMKSIPEIAKELDVNYIVEGSGQKYGNTFRLRVQLIAADHERHLWADSYEQVISEPKEIFRIQNQIAQRIAEELKVTITPEEKQSIEKIPTNNLMAYDLYLRGMDTLNKVWSYNENKQTFSFAREMFDKALSYDSTFSLAYIGLANVYWFAHLNDESFYSKNYLDSVLILANKALSFNDHLAEGYKLRGGYYIRNGKTEQAIKEWDKALKYNPNYDEVYWAKGLNIYFGDYDHMDFVKGFECLHKAISLNRENVPGLLRELGEKYRFWAGFPEKQKDYIQEAFKIDNDSAQYYNGLASFESDEKRIESLFKSYVKDTNNMKITFSLASTYCNLGQYEEALKYFRKIEKKLKENSPFASDEGIFYRFKSMIGYLYSLSGDKKEAEKWFNEQKRLDEESLKLGRNFSIDANFDLVSLYALMGNKEKAYENLRIISKIRVCPWWMLTVLKSNSSFNSVRNEPEFQQIVSDLETKYQAEHERVRKWLEKKGKQ